MDDQHAAACVRRLGPRRLQFTLRAGPGDRSGGQRGVHPGGGLALEVAAPEEVTGAFAVGLLFWLLSLHAAIRAVAAAVLTPSSASRRRASRLDNRPST